MLAPAPTRRLRLVVAIALTMALGIGGVLALRSHAVRPSLAPGKRQAPAAVAPGARPPSPVARGVVPLPTPSANSSPPATPARPVVLHVPILIYHVIAPWSVAQAYSQRALDVDPTMFAAQLTELRLHGWRTITMDQLAHLLASGTPAPPKTFVITIDDGYADGFTYALPILNAEGFDATFYVVPGRVGRHHVLTWDQIRALAAAGMEIGNHTLHHLQLNRLPASVADAEIAAAELELTAELGRAPTTLAYPFGGFDPAVAKEAELAGMWVAATTRWGTSETWAERMAIPRFHIAPSESPAVVLTICEQFH